MSNPVDLLPRTGIASTVWTSSDGHPHIRVYTQDTRGGIRESRYDAGWTGGNPNDVIVTAKPHSPIAVTSWNNGQQIRLYYLTEKNQINEHCWDGNRWFAGALNSSQVATSPISQLAAINWNNGGNINVYYQKVDNVIQEVRYASSKWFSDKTLSLALTGSNIAAIVRDNGKGIRVYSQRPDTVCIEDAWDQGTGWYKGGFSAKGPASTALAAIAWSGQIRVYNISPENSLDEYQWGGQKWTGPSNITKTSPASNLAAITWGSGPEIRVYRQANDNQILEQLYSGGWHTGSIIPTGRLQ